VDVSANDAAEFQILYRVGQKMAPFLDALTSSNINRF